MPGVKYALWYVLPVLTQELHPILLAATQITPAKPRYTGKSYLVSTIIHSNPFHATISTKVGAGSSLTIGSGKYIMIQRQGDGSYRTSFGLAVPETFLRSPAVDLADVEATRQLLLSDFYPDWSEDYKSLIRHSADFRAWPLYTLAAGDMGWSSVPGATLAGDAAHLAYPGGEGVNLAMTDALQLTERIADFGVEGIDQAVREYESDMFPRAVAAIGESTSMAEVMYSEDPEAFVRLICS